MESRVCDRIRVIVQGEKAREGTSFKFMAKRCGIDQKTFSAMLYGRQAIRADELERICKALNIQPNVILGFNDTAEPAEIAEVAR